jgi:hypothetical protein
MTRADWLDEFTTELTALRPHLGEPFARSVATLTFHALGSVYDPRKAALEYHMRQESLRPRPGSNP